MTAVVTERLKGILGMIATMIVLYEEELSHREWGAMATSIIEDWNVLVS